MHRLYSINGSCSDGVASFFRYIGADFADLPRAEHRTALETLNPWASVPTLETSEGPLTESGAILVSLAAEFAPQLLGQTDREKAKVLETLFFLNSTFYYAFIPYFRPEKYAQSDDARGEVKTAALEQIADAAKRLSQLHASSTNLVGDTLTVCDFIGLVYLKWLSKVAPSVMTETGLDRVHDHLVALPYMQPAKTLAPA